MKNESWFWITQNGKIRRITWQEYRDYQVDIRLGKKTRERLFLGCGRRWAVLARGKRYIHLYGKALDAVLDTLILNVEAP